MRETLNKRKTVKLGRKRLMRLFSVCAVIVICSVVITTLGASYLEQIINGGADRAAAGGSHPTSVSCHLSAGEGGGDGRAGAAKMKNVSEGRLKV